MKLTWRLRRRCEEASPPVIGMSERFVGDGSLRPSGRSDARARRHEREVFFLHLVLWFAG